MAGLFALVNLIGGAIAYELGAWMGGRILDKWWARWLFPESARMRAEEMGQRHGGMFLLIARFIPGVASVALLMAGLMHEGRVRVYALLGLTAVAHMGLFYALMQAMGAGERAIAALFGFSSALGWALVGLIALLAAGGFIRRYTKWRKRMQERGEQDEDTQGTSAL
nr:hypothetical protein [bacterium]